MDLSEKRLFVMGGANGCGEGTVKGSISEGATVVSTDIGVERGQRIVEELDAGERLRLIPLDLSNRAQVFDVVDQAADWMGGRDAVVDSGGNVLFCAPETITDEMWDRIFGVDGGGTVIDFGSAAAIRGAPTFSIYTAGKGAVFAWTRANVIDGSQHNIRASAIAAYLESSLHKQGREKSPEQAQRLTESVKAVTKIRETLGRAEQDLAPMILLLAKYGGTYITGHVLTVDAGFAMLGS